MGRCNLARFEGEPGMPMQRMWWRTHTGGADSTAPIPQVVHQRPPTSAAARSTTRSPSPQRTRGRRGPQRRWRRADRRCCHVVLGMGVASGVGLRGRHHSGAGAFCSRAVAPALPRALPAVRCCSEQRRRAPCSAGEQGGAARSCPDPCRTGCICAAVQCSSCAAQAVGAADAGATSWLRLNCGRWPCW